MLNVGDAMAQEDEPSGIGAQEEGSDGAGDILNWEDRLPCRVDEDLRKRLHGISESSRDAKIKRLSMLNKFEMERANLIARRKNIEDELGLTLGLPTHPLEATPNINPSQNPGPRRRRRQNLNRRHQVRAAGRHVILTAQLYKNPRRVKMGRLSIHTSIRAMVLVHHPLFKARRPYLQLETVLQTRIHLPSNTSPSLLRHRASPPPSRSIWGQLTQLGCRSGRWPNWNAWKQRRWPTKTNTFGSECCIGGLRSNVRRDLLARYVHVCAFR